MAQLAIAMMAYGQYRQGQIAEAEGKSAENLMKYNAAVERREAQAKRAKGTMEQKMQARRAARTKGAIVASMAHAGGLGSPVSEEIMAEQAAESELENLLIGYEAEIDAQRHESQAALDEMQGKIYRKRGRETKKAAMWSAGGTLLTGFASTPAPTDAQLARKHGII